MWSSPEPTRVNRVIVAESLPHRGRSRLAELDGLLAPWHVAVRRAFDWRETVDSLACGGFDLAVLSSEATVGDALSGLRLVRSRFAQLPCLLITPDTGAATLHRALELEAYSVIRQPADARMLAGLMLRILGKRFHGSEDGRPDISHPTIKGAQHKWPS